MRLTRITGVDLRLFDFDYDLTWMAFILNADGHVYARYGGRDAGSAERRLSLAGLAYTLRAALAMYHRDPDAQPTTTGGPPVHAEDYAAAKRLRPGECIHCHQVSEFRRAARKEAGTFRREELWVYPLPENVGLALDVDAGNHVKSVAPGSPAAAAGLQPGDVVETINGQSVTSFADVQYALHRAPAAGEVPITWRRGSESASGTLLLADGWRKTNLTWRPSLLDILASLPLYGDDLTAEEKKALGLAPNRLAFRQDATVHRLARAAGVRGGDVILGINGQALAMTRDDFLAHIHRNFLVGDQISLNILRDGKRLDLPMTLR